MLLSVRVFYRANVIGDVVPSENPLQLGVTRLGEVLSKEIRLQSTSGRAFEVDDVIDSSGMFGWSVDSCVESAEGCRRLVLRLAPEVPQPLVGNLRVHLVGDPDPITLGDGSGAAPSYSFANDNTSGLFLDSGIILIKPLKTTT